MRWVSLAVVVVAFGVMGWTWWQMWQTNRRSKARTRRSRELSEIVTDETADPDVRIAAARELFGRGAERG